MWLSLGLCSTCECNILAAEAVCCFPQSNTAWSRTTKTDRRQRGQSSQRKRFPGYVLAAASGPRHWYSGSAFQHERIVYRALPLRQDLLCVRSWQERRTDVKHLWLIKAQGLPREMINYKVPIMCSKPGTQKSHRRQLLCPLGF